MKKLFLLTVVTMLTTSVMAQDSDLVLSDPQTTSSSEEQRVADAPHVRRMLLERAGNTYYYGDQKMRRRQMLDWYAQHNSKVAYDQFRSGYKLATAGWWCLGVGLACDVAGLGCVVAGGVTAGMNSSSSPRNLPTVFYVGRGLVLAGSVLEIASIPCLIVGYVRMHESVNTYNAEQSYAHRPQPYWSIQAGNTGLGLALHF